MARYVRSFWVNTEAILDSPEKHMQELRYLGADELFLLSIVGQGALYPSRIFISAEKARKRDLLGPVVKEAKKHGMKVHGWVVAFNRPSNELVSSHREWYILNRNKESCIDRPAYVPDYLWLCPSQQGPTQFMLGGIQELLQFFDLDGVHLDYIRLPDIFLPEGLRQNYGLEREKEVYQSQFDFCYCDTCRNRFKEDHGIDPIDIEFGTRPWYTWVSWRADRITAFVSRFHKSVKAFDSEIETSAAVFATPGLAYRYVFQRWGSWPIDHLEPMIYHEYYGKPVEWIGEAVAEGVSTGKMIMAGILLGFLRKSEDIGKATQLAMTMGAQGICFFVYPIPHPQFRDEIKQALSSV